ncbi:hypothetical protein TorRG33x02_334010, partial [Trema orientale]
MKSAPSLISDDDLEDDHGRDSNLGLRDGGNDLGFRDDSLLENTVALENLGGVSHGGVKSDSRVDNLGVVSHGGVSHGGVKNDSRVDNLGVVSRGGVKSDSRAEDTAVPLRKVAATNATLGFGVGGITRPVLGSGIAATNTTSGPSWSTAGYDIVTTDPINTLKNKRFSQPDLLHADHANSGLISGMVTGPPLRPDFLQAGPSTLPPCIAKSGHGPSFANVVSGLNSQDQI